MNAKHQIVSSDTEFVMREQIERIVRMGSQKDAQDALDMLRSVLGDERYNGADDLIQRLEDPATSVILKSLALFIHRLWRKRNESDTAGSVAALKELFHLRERLRTMTSGSPESRYLETDTHPHKDVIGDLPDDSPDAVQNGIILVYELCVGRRPVQEEIDIWKTHFSSGVSFPRFLSLMHDSEEGRQYRQSTLLLPELSDGAFIQHAYETIYSRGCTAGEMRHWTQLIDSGRLRRVDVLTSMFGDTVRTSTQNTRERLPEHDPQSCLVMGTGRVITIKDWKERESAILGAEPDATLTPIAHSRFYIRRAPTVLITALTSLYRGGKFIEHFMENITSQTCFRDYCELIIIDADSPENESEIIARFCKQHDNIVYRRMNHRIGIYEAWNVGVKLARGEYLTNTNLDDLRRNDSLELQAAVLDNLSFVDVVYQDFYYSFDPDLTFQEIAKFGFKSNLPIITSHNLMQFNSPHNAPMWRRRLHDELGLFDASYKSAGDYEFWMRCQAAQRAFYKINDPHVVYYQNPEGLSTRPDTRGVEEAQRIMKTYARRLISSDAVVPLQTFSQRIWGDSLPTQPVNENRYASVQVALRAVADRLKFAPNVQSTQQ